MSALNPGEGEIFTIRVYKRMDIAGDRMWANTYEVQAVTAPSYADLVAVADKLVAFEKAIHQDTVVFDRALISSYVEDGQPYDPDTFISLPQSGNGAVTSPAAEAVLPLQVVLFVRREVPSGRTGKAFYRGCLGEADVNGRFGTVQLTSPATIQLRVTGAANSSGMDDLLGTGDVTPFRLVMASGVPGLGTTTRRVTALTAVSAAIVKYNNRYFDRA